jgi:hypothetical protein
MTLEIRIFVNNMLPIQAMKKTSFLRVIIKFFPFHCVSAIQKFNAIFSHFNQNIDLNCYQRLGVRLSQISLQK